MEELTTELRKLFPNLKMVVHFDIGYITIECTLKQLNLRTIINVEEKLFSNPRQLIIDKIEQEIEYAFKKLIINFITNNL